MALTPAQLAQLEEAQARLRRENEEERARLRQEAIDILAHIGREQDGYVLVQAEYVESLRRYVHESWGFDRDSR